MGDSNSRNKLYLQTRNLHLYLGLFVSPFLLIYAISVFFLNHDWLPWSEANVEMTSHRISIPEEGDSREIARLVIQQLEITGEMGWVNHNQETGILSFPLNKPGINKLINVNLSSGTAELKREVTGIWDAMVFLHEMPGSHLVRFRGNWIFVQLWGWLADLTAYLILFVTASGVYMWSVLKSERKTGFLFLGTGLFSIFLIIAAMLR